jgi:hypothetical protein
MRRLPSDSTIGQSNPKERQEVKPSIFSSIGHCTHFGWCIEAISPNILSCTQFQIIFVNLVIFIVEIRGPTGIHQWSLNVTCVTTEWKASVIAPNLSFTIPHYVLHGLTWMAGEISSRRVIHLVVPTWLALVLLCLKNIRQQRRRPLFHTTESIIENLGAKVHTSTRWQWFYEICIFELTPAMILQILVELFDQVTNVTVGLAWRERIPESSLGIEQSQSLNLGATSLCIEASLSSSHSSFFVLQGKGLKDHTIYCLSAYPKPKDW